MEEVYVIFENQAVQVSSLDEHKTENEVFSLPYSVIFLIHKNA